MCKTFVLNATAYDNIEEIDFICKVLRLGTRMKKNIISEYP